MAKSVFYNFKAKCETHKLIQNFGKTDNPFRTATSHWTIYSKHDTKRISFDINNIAKIKDVDFQLELIEQNGNKKYFYKNEEINRDKFISLLKEEL